MNNKLFFRLGTNSRWIPTKEQIRKIQGSFCVPDLFAYIEHGDYRRLWTPATLAYDESFWDYLIDAYKAANPNYTHYVINLAGSTYHDDYPHIDDNPQRARRLILKLLSKKLIPICCATNDEQPDIVLRSYSENHDVIDCSFVMWEMNGPCEGK